MLLSDDDTLFPELDADERHVADEWLNGYLRLVLRILRERRTPSDTITCPHPPIDGSRGTGTIGTPRNNAPSASP